MITSLEQTFDSLNSDGLDALAVRPGLPVRALLELSSCRLSVILELLREQAEGEEGLSQNTLYVVQELTETAKAMVDACTAGILRGGSQ